MLQLFFAGGVKHDVVFYPVFIIFSLTSRAHPMPIVCIRFCVLPFLCGQSGELMEEVRHVICAKGDNIKADGNGPRTIGQQNADDTAIVQSVGAPFAAIQWCEADSLNNFRCGHSSVRIRGL